MNLAKIIFMLKHSVKLRRYLLRGCVAACCSMQYNFSQVQVRLPDGGRRPKHVGAIFICNLM